MLEILGVLAAAVGPALFWLWFAWRRDRFEAEPRRLVLTTFLLGGLATIAAALVETALGSDLAPATPTFAGLAVSAVFVVGPRESPSLGKKCLTHLLVQSMNLVQQAELIPPSVQSAATAGFDGQIHDAPSRLRCHQVQASCYQPTPTRQTSSPQGEGRYGYRSLPAQLVAPTWRVNWTLDEAELAPANTHEESLAGDLLRRVVGEYFWLRVTTAVGDAGLGYGPFLGVYLPTTPPHSLRIPNR